MFKTFVSSFTLLQYRSEYACQFPSFLLTNALTFFAKLNVLSSRSYCFEFRILVIRICLGFSAIGGPALGMEIFEFRIYHPLCIVKVQSKASPVIYLTKQITDFLIENQWVFRVF